MAKSKGQPEKNIFLFSDGTGNSSGKLQKTNVWRLYEALDLGDPPATGGRAQIAYYDNGVGTSSVPLLAMIGGAFGLGLPRNIQDIYKYLCRNYRPGDRIYAFGFSRGAFTIRLVAGVICRLGIIQADGETDLDLQARDVWREFRKESEPYLFKGLTRLIRKAVTRIVRIKRTWFGQRSIGAALKDAKKPPRKGEIEFLGVWDTVAAYGGPIIEFTRGVDIIIWPLTMNDFRLSKEVKCARHALSIDDKRDAFLPLPWDEVHEADLIKNKGFSPNRLRQVWFAGMHSDVGGGYSDETLSFVSLVWMIDQFKGPDIRFISETETRIRKMKNAFGPMHDSRHGAGVFYRFQPRPLTAWLKPSLPSSWVHLDPSIDRGAVGKSTMSFGTRGDGLLRGPIKVHCSAWDRMQSGTDGYAPINLPSSFDVVDNSYRLDEQTREVVTGLNKRVRGDKRIARSAEWSGGMVMWRRIAYFLAIGVLLLLLLLPFLSAADDSAWPLKRLLNARPDARDVVGPIGTLLTALLPKFAEIWTNAWLTKLLATVITCLVLAAAIMWGHSLERGLTDQFARGPDKVVPKKRRRADRVYRWLSASVSAQKAFFYYKWYVVPVVFGSLLLAAGIWVGSATINRIWLIPAENRACKVMSKPSPLIPGKPRGFIYDLKNPCMSTGIEAKAKQIYTVEMTPIVWSDGTEPASPDGWTDWSWKRLSSGLGTVGVPFKRVIRAPYLAPLVEIKNGTDAIHVQRLSRQANDGKTWTGTFKAERDGNLFFFVNDAAYPEFSGFPKSWSDFKDQLFSLSGRYQNNCADRQPHNGRACPSTVKVTIST